MNDFPKVVFSNRVEILYQGLKRELFGALSRPFTKRLVIVPSPAMKTWLLLQMANDPDMGIATGIEVVYLNQAMDDLLIKEQDTNKKIPSPLEMALAIEAQILEVIQQEGASDVLWKPLMTYLHVKDKRALLSKKSEKRLAALSERLARLGSRLT